MGEFISYAEYLEDLILWKVFEKEKNGIYVDVGAGDPLSNSVTKHFYDLGWQGINVEPFEEAFNKLLALRPRDFNLRVAASNKSGEVTLYVAPPGASSVSSRTLKSLRKNNALIGEEVVPTRTLSEIIAQCQPILTPSDSIQFLKIDVEGHEYEVLEGLDLKFHRPLVIVMESVVPWNGAPSFSTWERKLLLGGYELALDYRNNRYYREINSNIEFPSIEKLLSEYEIFVVTKLSDKYRLAYLLLEALFQNHRKTRLLVLRLIRLIYPLFVRLFPSLKN